MVLPERIVPVPSATYAASFAISILRGCIGRPSRHAAVFVRQGLRDGRSGAADRLDAKPFVIFHHDDASLGRLLLPTTVDRLRPRFFNRPETPGHMDLVAGR